MPRPTNQRLIQTRSKALAAALDRWFRRLGLLLARDAVRRINNRFAKADSMAGLEAELAQLLTDFGVRQVDDAGGRAAARAKGDWVLPPLLRSRVARQKEVRAQLIIEETRTQVRESLQTLIAESLAETPQPSASELARRIRTQYHGPPESRESLFGPERSLLIARTELVQDVNTGTYFGYASAGVKALRWLSFQGGGRGHGQMNNEVSPLGVPFTLPDGTKMRYPGDPNAPIKHLANCRCDIAPVVSAAADRALRR